MKHIILTAAFLLSAVFCTAQSPVPDQDTIKNPVKQGDPAPQVVPPPANNNQKSMVTIKSSQVPDPVRKKLEHSAYKGWEKKATIYRNQSSTWYLIEFRENGKVRKYRFDKNGQQLEDDEL